VKRIVTVIGARPQFVKASVVSEAFRQSGAIDEIVVHTGQHYDANMSEVFFNELGMAAPRYHLGIGGGTHGEMTGRMLMAIERILVTERPDAVLVYGDTNSTLAGSLAAAKLHIPVAHVEAGLRSFNLRMPEEVNRILTDRISQWLFTPTHQAAANLRVEGVPPDRIVPVGDVMYDVAITHGGKSKPNGGAIAELGLEPGRYMLVTIHRAENTDVEDRFRVIVRALEELSRSTTVVWPVHPRTRAAIDRLAGGEMVEGIRLVEPLGYGDMVQLERFAAVIVTDSGGVQKEAYFHSVPCVTVRDETEWIELVKSGWNRLAPPTTPQRIVDAVMAAKGTTGLPVSLYGKGEAATQIVARLLRDL
jgi:UDP-GlcNAc3NAcA epimerase